MDYRQVYKQAMVLKNITHLYIFYMTVLLSRALFIVTVCSYGQVGEPKCGTGKGIGILAHFLAQMLPVYVFSVLFGTRVST